MKKLYLLFTYSFNFFVCLSLHEQNVDNHKSKNCMSEPPVKLLKAQQLFVRDIVKLLQKIHEDGYEVTFGEAMRSKIQAMIYSIQGIGVVDSLHGKRLAIDLNLFDKDNKYLTNTKDHEPFGLYWESLSPYNRWGGRFTKPDGNHYERNLECIER